MKRFGIIMIMVLAAVAARAQFLWKVSGNGVTEPSYLLGTLHLAPIDSIKRIANVDSILDNVHAVMCELDVTDKVKMNAAGEAMTRYSQAPADSLLSDLLTQAQLDSIEAVFAKHMDAETAEFMVEVCDGLKPLATSIMLSQYTISKGTVLDLVKTYGWLGSVDEIVIRKGRRRSLPLIELETTDEQMQLLMNISLKEQAKALLSLLREPDNGLNTLKDMIDMYVSGDIKALDKLFLSEKNTLSPTDNLRIFEARNRAWLPRFEEAIHRQPVLMAVGAGHLVTPNGLLALLREKGYTLEPVIPQ